MNFEEIEKMVLDWGKKRNLLTDSTREAQIKKLGEEYEELEFADMEGQQHKLVDAIGDMLVVLTFIAYFSGMDLTRCYAIAYSEIKNRKGKMVNGLFVKE